MDDFIETDFVRGYTADLEHVSGPAWLVCLWGSDATQWPETCPLPDEIESLP